MNMPNEPLQLPVTECRQKDMKFYIGTVAAPTLISRMKVDVWSTRNMDGYQRPLVEKRISEVAWYVVKSDGVFPTSVSVSLRCDNVKFEEEGTRNGIAYGKLIIPEGVDFWIIDGQHRLASLQKLSDTMGEKELVDNYVLPVNFLLDPKKLNEVRYFYLINSRAKAVPTDIADRILQQVRKEKGDLWMMEHGASQPAKAEKEALQARATDVVDFLRKDCSVWQKMVDIPGEPKPNRHAVRQHALVASLLEGPMKHSTLKEMEPKSLADLLHRYWCAMARTFPETFLHPEDYVIQRQTAVYALHLLFCDVFERCREQTSDPNRYNEERMFELLQQMAKSGGIDSAWWHRENGDPRAISSGMKMVRLLAASLKSHLPPLTLAGL
jgi:DGQHR domain-containing protein